MHGSSLRAFVVHVGALEADAKIMKFRLNHRLCRHGDEINVEKLALQDVHGASRLHGTWAFADNWMSRHLHEL